MSTRKGLARGGRIVGRTIAMLRERDGNSCGRCGVAILDGVSGLHPDGATIGHRVPAAQGGTDELSNLRLEHRRCNLAAGARTSSPRARIVAPVALASLVILTAWVTGSVGATSTDYETVTRARLLSCVLIDEARERGIPARSLPRTLASCRALR